MDVNEFGTSENFSLASPEKTGHAMSMPMSMPTSMDLRSHVTETGKIGVLCVPSVIRIFRYLYLMEFLPFLIHSRYTK